jgi:hypothetical protein
LRRNQFLFFSRASSSPGLNNAYNTIRKAFPDAFADEIEGAGLHPARMNLNTPKQRDF